MAVQVMRGKYPHVGWVDIEGQGVLSEIAIMKNSATGLMFIKLNQLDAIDKQRLFRVITNRSSHLYELWDLMSNLTLGNGANALEYFHQYVKILTPTGQVMTPQMGAMGNPNPTGLTRMQPRNQQNQGWNAPPGWGPMPNAGYPQQNMAPQPIAERAPAPAPEPAPAPKERSSRPRRASKPSGTSE